MSSVAATVRLIDEQGRELASRWGDVESFEVEADGPVRATVAVKGAIADNDGDGELSYTARINFYAGTGMVRVHFTLANRNPTKIFHDADGDSHWLLGQPGNVFFEDFSLCSALDFSGPIVMSVGDGHQDILDRVVLTAEGGIYQESSGGDNWYGRIHMNHKFEIPMRFRGAKNVPWRGGTLQRGPSRRLASRCRSPVWPGGGRALVLAEFPQGAHCHSRRRSTRGVCSPSSGPTAMNFRVARSRPTR